MHRSHSKLNGNRLILFMLIILSFNINISDPLTIHLKCHIIFSVGRWKLRFFNDFLCLLTIVSDFLTTRRWIDIHSRKAMIIQQCRNRNFAKYNTGTVRLQRQLNFASVCNFSTLSWFWDFWGSAEEATRQHHIDAKTPILSPICWICCLSYPMNDEGTSPSVGPLGIDHLTASDERPCAPTIT